MDSHTRNKTESPAKRNSWKKDNLSIDIMKCAITEQSENDLYYQIKEMNLMREFLKSHDGTTKDVTNNTSTNNIQCLTNNNNEVLTLQTEFNGYPEISNFSDNRTNNNLCIDLTKNTYNENTIRQKSRKELQLEDNTTRNDSIFSCYCNSKQGLCVIF